MKTGMTKKEQAERTRAAILEGAIGLFARKGFASTSTQDLSKAVGVTPGALYWHFEDKEALLIAVLSELQARLAAELAAARRKQAPSGPRETLEALVWRVSKVVERHQEYLLLVGGVSAEATDVNPRVEKALREAYRGIAVVVEAILDQGSAAGLIDSDLDRPCAAQLFMGMYMGGIMHQRLFREELPLARALPVLRRMLMSALFPVGRVAGARRRGSSRT
jgi:AcrR family transcriptional regulator